MRSAMMVTAALAVAVVAKPAGAVTLLLEPNDQFKVVSGGQTTTCPIFSQSCEVGPPSFNYALPSFAVDAASLDGTYLFGPSRLGPDSNAGIYDVTGSIVFRNGSLISDVLNFTYSSSQVGGGIAITTVATGYVDTFGLLVFDPDPRLLIPVPEPKTWAMMLIGFAAIGRATRVRKRRVAFA